jgi:hypothetical protein
MNLNLNQEARVQHWFAGWSQKQTPDLVLLLLLVAGFLLRVALAWFTFLNPD